MAHGLLLASVSIDMFVSFVCLPVLMLKMYSHRIYETRCQQLSDIRILVQQTDGVFTILVVHKGQKNNFKFITSLLLNICCGVQLLVSNNHRANVRCIHREKNT